MSAAPPGELPCAQCGAAIDLPPGVTRLSCGHCGGRLQLVAEEGVARLALATGIGAMELRTRLAVVERELLRLEERHEELVVKLRGMQDSWFGVGIAALGVALGLWWTYKLPDRWLGLGVAACAIGSIVVDVVRMRARGVKRADVARQKEASWRAGQRLTAEREALLRGEVGTAGGEGPSPSPSPNPTVGGGGAVEVEQVAAQIAGTGAATRSLLAGLQFEAAERELSLLSVQRTSLRGETGGDWTAHLFVAAPPLALAGWAVAGAPSMIHALVAGAGALGTGWLATRVLAEDRGWRRDHDARIAEIERRHARAMAAWEAAR